MKIWQVTITWLLIAGLSVPAFADDFGARPTNESAAIPRNAASSAVGSLRESAVRVAEQATQSQGEPMPRGYLWVGTAMFVGGLATGLYGFLNNQNGSFPEFSEAEATNKALGAAGLAVAFAGGAVLFLGKKKANGSTTVNFGGRRGLTLSHRLSW